MSDLPIRIMQMVQQLHNRGYTSIYLHSGLSPSGMYWRYSIGQLMTGYWPAYPTIISGSVSKEGETIWALDNSTVRLLTDGFESHFKDLLISKDPHTDYSKWYAKLLSGLEADEMLVFFADYGAKHQHHLASAPGYRGIKPHKK